MNTIPSELENIILDYKYQLDVCEREYREFLNELRSVILLTQSTDNLYHCMWNPTGREFHDSLRGLFIRYMPILPPNITDEQKEYANNYLRNAIFVHSNVHLEFLYTDLDFP